MMSDKIRNGANLSSQNGSTKNEVYNFYWGLNLGAIVCENCDWRFFHTNKNSISCCPYCYSHKLTWPVCRCFCHHIFARWSENYLTLHCKSHPAFFGSVNCCIQLCFVPAWPTPYYQPELKKNERLKIRWQGPGQFPGHRLFEFYDRPRIESSYR